LLYYHIYIYHCVSRFLSFRSRNNTLYIGTQFFHDCLSCFTHLSQNNQVRCCILRADGKYFTVGLDLKDAANNKKTLTNSDDVARKAIRQRQHVSYLQSTFNIIESCPFPIIFAAHGAVIGGGIDLSCCCDIRLCSEEAWFCIKEVDVGLCADLGTLQRLPKIIGNMSTIKELAYTARPFSSKEAFRLGFVSRVYSTKEELYQSANTLAEEICQKSPVAIMGTKVNLNYAQMNGQSVKEALEYQSTWSASMLQSEDLPKSFVASLHKKKATYSKL